MEERPATHVSTDELLQRIDALERQVRELRSLILAQYPPTSPADAPAGLADRLAGALAPKSADQGFSALEEYERMGDVGSLVGALGQGTWEEYDDDAEWERFAS